MNERIEQINPDVVHLNWMGRGMMSHRSIGEISRPIVWRFPDMNALTGGCYYSYGCERFVDQCGSCPQLDSDSDYDLSHLNWHRKRHHWKDLDITVVAPSTWLAEQAQKSSLFGHRQIEVIPNALDTDLFKPRQQALGRELFDLPKHKHLVLFGAVDPVGDQRKGSDLLKDSLQQLSSDNQNIELVVFGSEEPENPPNFNFPTNYVGYLHDEQSLALLYSAADVMVVPSRYEGFGQTVSESLACGTPVVAFNTTGPSDIITHKQTGYLAKPFDSGQLKSGISWILESDRRRERLSDAAREEAVNRYHQTVIGERYLNLYHDIC
jgi:glycosyltransferase involved in cell wall biosynthesis